jgi:hypothetical protein
MGIFKNRSDYYKQLAIDNKLVAHTRDTGDGERNSFFRLNDEEELQAACVIWAHFPCVNHFGFDGRYTSNINSVAKRKLSDDLLFLSKALATDMDGIEAAYDESFEVMEQWLSKMQNQFDTDGSCSPFGVFDLSRCSFQRYTVNGNLFGWLLSIEDEAYANEVNKFDATQWFE